MSRKQNNTMPESAAIEAVKPNPAIIVIMWTVVAVIISVIGIKAMTPAAPEASRTVTASMPAMRAAGADILTGDEENEAGETNTATPTSGAKGATELQPLTVEEIDRYETVNQLPHEDAVYNEAGQIVGYMSVGEADYVSNDQN